MRKYREIIIKSSLDNLVRVESFIEEIAYQFNLNDSYFGNMLIAVTEAVKNAIVHGNLNNIEREVHVICTSERPGLKFTIVNQGKGFDFSSYLDKNKLLDNDELSTRGILLIHSLSDGIKYSDRGRKLEILFKITGIDSMIVEQRQLLMNSYFLEQKKILK